MLFTTQDSLAQQVAKPKAAPAAAAAAAAVPASNPAGSLHEALAKSTPKFRTLLDVIKLSPANVPKNVVGTIFAPTDAVRVVYSAPTLIVVTSHAALRQSQCKKPLMQVAQFYLLKIT